MNRRVKFRGKGPLSDLARWPIGFYVLAKAIPEQQQVCGFGPGIRAFTSWRRICPTKTS
jgi:hypothetical protein